MAVACASGTPWLAVAATVANYLCAGLMAVPVFKMIYRWAQGPQPATDYALLFGAAFFAGMPPRVASPAIAGWLGWPGYFASALPIYAVAATWLVVAIGRTLRADRAQAA
jgi:hypothetical protein